MRLCTRFTLIAIVFFVTLSPHLPLKADTIRHPVLFQPHDILQARLETLYKSINSGSLGIAVLDIQSTAQWRINSEQSFPMMSVFKVPVAAAVLEQVDQGHISLQKPITVTRAELRGGVIRDNFRGERMTFTVQQLLQYSVSRSDNTAVDALIKLIGGPAAVTSFLRTHDINGMRVDLDEEGLSDLLTNTGPTASIPTDETPQAKDQRLRSGLRAFLADPRDRSTPDAAVMFLKKLQSGALLSQPSTLHLLDLMYGQTTPRRLREGLPVGVALADKCGTSTSLHGVTAAYNDIGIMTWPDGRQVIVAVFLSASEASQAKREKLFADIAQAIGDAAEP
jgi:beta-lactamase class A